MPAPTGRARIRSRFRSINAHDEQKKLSSEEMDTVKKGREPYNSVDCQRRSAHYEEAHVFVHDLNQFVTVQLLKEMPAVLTLGNLWEDHGYSCECWSAVKSHD